jgi:hypothetical protein
LKEVTVIGFNQVIMVKFHQAYQIRHFGVYKRKDLAQVFDTDYNEFKIIKSN